jgi:hypothetical protein
MTMIVQVVRTPSDLARTLEAHLCRVNHWTEGPGRPVGALIEQILGEAFMGRGGERSGEAEDPFEAIAEPLDRLHERGLQLVAVISRGRYRLPRPGRSRREIGFELSDYLVAPAPCYFRSVNARFNAPIHTLGSACEAGHATIVSEPEPGERQRAFQIWTSTATLIRDFERAVPWCDCCRPESA